MTNDKYKNFILWKANPSRRPKKLAEFCDKFNITKKEISEFVTRPNYSDDLQHESVNFAKKNIPKLLEILFEQAMKKKTAASIKAYNDMLKEAQRITEGKEKSTSILRDLYNQSKQTS